MPPFKGVAYFAEMPVPYEGGVLANLVWRQYLMSSLHAPSFNQPYCLRLRLSFIAFLCRQGIVYSTPVLLQSDKSIGSPSI